MSSDSVKPCFVAEFSLALNNRTGKYYMCKDIIENQNLICTKVNYWRTHLSKMPVGLAARILGRLMKIEIDYRAKFVFGDKILPLMKSSDKMIFMDPLQVVLYDIKETDIIICHDMGPITHPMFYAPLVHDLYSRIFEKISRIRPHLVFVSEVSKHEYISLYGTSFNKAVVIPCSVREGIIHGEEVKVENIGENFLLTVGAVGTRKNQKGLIEAYNLANLSSLGVKLVIVGGNEPGFQEARHLALQSNGVITAGYVSEQNLRWLYRNSRGLVLPSHLEGFGIPAAEALFSKLVPLVTHGGALAEAAGKGAITVDPTDIKSIADGLLRLVNMSQRERSERIEMGLIHAQNYTEFAVRQKWDEFLKSV